MINASRVGEKIMEPMSSPRPCLEAAPKGQIKCHFYKTVRRECNDESRLQAVDDI